MSYMYIGNLTLKVEALKKKELGLTLLLTESLAYT